MSLVFLGTSRRSKRTILIASKRISKMLLIRASKGARGKAATNMVVKLNWTTGVHRQLVSNMDISFFATTSDLMLYSVLLR